MIPSLTSLGTLQTLLAGSCILLGAIQLLAAKGGIGHRARGYAFVYGMLTADAAALLIYRFTGHFNILHVGAIANVACVLLAMVPLLRTPRPANWRDMHYALIAWSYVGLLAAATVRRAIRSGGPKFNRTGSRCDRQQAGGRIVGRDRRRRPACEAIAAL